MTKKMTQFRNLAIILLSIEILIVFLLYFTLQRNILLFLSFYVLVKNIIIFIGILYASNILDNDMISVQDALNEDAKNAFIFGGVGLIQYDTNRNVTWVSDLLLAMNVNIVGVKLLEWQPTLASLFEEEDEVRLIDLKSKKFEVYINQDTHLVYLKDVTEFISLQQDFNDQQICVAYITIDNYEETVENADEAKAVTIQSLSRQIIVDWATENGMIIRRYKSGGFLAFFNERIYNKQVENKFEILNIFKRKFIELEEVLTLSIGIGRGTRVLAELDQLAAQALRLTYSRGGDQVAIKSGKDNVRYFGGTTEAFEKSSKVRARVISQTLSGLIRRSSNVFIMGHKNSDLDSLGSSIGMLRMVESFDKQGYIIIDTNSLEEKTSNVVHHLLQDVENEKVIRSQVTIMDKINKDSLLIVVDNHKPTLVIAPVLLEKIKKKVIIDHHRRGEEFIDSPVLTYLEPSASSAVELIVELMRYTNTNVKISEEDATIMYAGMLVDTNYFKQRVGVRTFQSAAQLKELQANVVKAYELLEDSYERTVEISNLTKSAYRFGDDILIACGRDDEVHENVVLAKSSNHLLSVLDVKASFTIGRINKETVSISARSSRDINVQMIMETLGGGGHFSMAACQIKDKNINEVRHMLEEAITKYLEDRG